MKSIYDFKLTTNDGKDFYLPKNKVLIIVNVASQCKLSKQYLSLQYLYDMYQDLEIVVFPCNSFGSQEPSADNDIKIFCEINFGIKFHIMKKTKVNGIDSEPLFTYLKKNARGFLGIERISWNFTKFLVSKNGKNVRRYSPITIPEKLIPDINFLLEY